MDINEKLRKAAKHGYVVRVKALLKNPSCDALAKNREGATALMLAARYGHEACVELLLPVSDALARDSKGITALMTAVCNGYEECVRLLLPVSDALSKDDEEMTSLMWAACHGYKECVSHLLPVSNPFAKDKGGLTASQWARKAGGEDLAQCIDAYARAQSEKDSISNAICPGAQRGRTVLRM